MGSKLVTAAVNNALPTIPPNNTAASLVLLLMARTAMDDDPDPMYWRGSDHLVTALGYESKSSAGHRRVERVLAYLIERGFIDQVTGTERRKARRWLLTYDREVKTREQRGKDAEPTPRDLDHEPTEESGQPLDLAQWSLESRPAVTAESRVRARATARANEEQVQPIRQVASR